MSTTSFTVTAKANCPKCDGVGLFVGASNRLTLCECASSVPSSVVLAVERSRSSPANALTPPTPEQPAVTGEPEKGTGPDWKCDACTYVNFDLRTRCRYCKAPRPAVSTTASEHTPDCYFGGREHVGFCTEDAQRAAAAPLHEQENIGISQTASGPSRPAVGSEGSASNEAFLARLNHVEFANRIAMALGLNVGDEHPFDNLVQRVVRLREIAALRHPNDLRARNDHLAANNSALNARATKAEAQLSSTRTALQRVREAATEVLEAHSRLDGPALRKGYAALRALTSTETDQ